MRQDDEGHGHSTACQPGSERALLQTQWPASCCVALDKSLKVPAASLISLRPHKNQGLLVLRLFSSVALVGPLLSMTSARVLKSRS